jgi:hypothetical protein
MEENKEIDRLNKELVNLKREVAYLRNELNMEVKHPAGAIFITIVLIGVGMALIYLKDHPELLNF